MCCGVSCKYFIALNALMLSCLDHGQVTVTEVLLYAARQSGTVCLLAYVLLTLLQLFVDS